MPHRQVTIVSIARRLWAYRAAVAGVTAVALAIVAEKLMRETNPGSDVGMHIMQVAVILVGVMAWTGQAPIHLKEAPSEDFARRRTPTLFLWVTERVGAVRRRWGRRVFAVGLSITLALALVLLDLLNHDFGSAFAPWLWLVMLAIFVLTFAGTGPFAMSPTGQVGDSCPETPVGRRELIVIGLIIVVAAAVRLWSLETVPTGPYTDEGDRLLDARHLNNGQLVNREQFLFFGTGWWGVPSIYFWLVAQSMRVFGDTLAGGRVVHALAGIATVWLVYRIGRTMWSPHVGLLAAALLAVSDFAIQFSRTAGESTITIFTWTACFYYLFRAIKWNRPLYWALGGIWGGLTLLGYASGKLLPIFLSVTGIFLLARWGVRGARAYLPGLAIMAVGVILTYGPNAWYVHLHPDAFYLRYDKVSVFVGDAARQAFATYGTHNWIIILAHQFGITFSAFDTGSDHGPFYPTSVPILPLLWAVFWVLGTAYMIWRLHDWRFVILGIWLVGALAGAATTITTPTLQRAAPIVPLLVLIPAIFLMRLAQLLPAWRFDLSRRKRPFRSYSLVYALPWILIVVLGIQSLNFYFGIYTPLHAWEDYSLAGRYAQTLSPNRDMIYHADIPERFWALSPDLFLAGKVLGRDLGNPAIDLPVWDNGAKQAHFLIFPSNAQYVPIVRRYYPGGREHVISNAHGLPWATDYIASSVVLDSARRVQATYRPTGGPPVRRLEARIGTVGSNGPVPSNLPPGITYPIAASWQGGLDAPAYGVYRLSLSAAAGATLTLDGQRVLAVGGAGPHERTVLVVLPRGVNTFRLTGRLRTPRSGIGIRWGATTGPLLPIARPFLWHAPLGTLLARDYAGATAAAVTAPRLDTTTLRLLSSRRDGVLGFHNVNLETVPGMHPFMDWRGTIVAPTSGTYLFHPETDGLVSIWIDGRRVGSNVGVSPSVPAYVSVTLHAGLHRFGARLLGTHDNQSFELYWQPPLGRLALVPPTALVPAVGGVWSPTTRTSVASVDAGSLTGTPVVPPAS